MVAIEENLKKQESFYTYRVERIAKISTKLKNILLEQHEYIEKIKSFIDDAKINTLTVMTMQVPCCAGLVAMARQALQSAKRKIPIKSIVVSLQGDVLSEDWV